MISSAVTEVGLYAGIGYCAGYITALGTNSARLCQVGGVIGAVAGLAHAILNPVAFFVAKDLQLEDYKVHLIKGALTALIATVAVVKLAALGIIGPVGIAVIGLASGYRVLTSLDNAVEKWGTHSFNIIQSKDHFLSQA